MLFVRSLESVRGEGGARSGNGARNPERGRTRSGTGCAIRKGVGGWWRDLERGTSHPERGILEEVGSGGGVGLLF